MTGKIEYSVEDGLLVIRSEGSYSVDALLGTIDEAFNSPLLPHAFALLMDISKASIKRSQKDYERLLQDMVSRSERITCLAFVTVSDEIFKVIEGAATFAEYNELGSVKPFRAVEDAREWLRHTNGCAGCA